MDAIFDAASSMICSRRLGSTWGIVAIEHLTFLLCMKQRARDSGKMIGDDRVIP
jgi:hypothetical protein